MFANEVLARTTARLASGLPDNAILVQSWQRSQFAGLDPDSGALIPTGGCR